MQSGFLAAVVQFPSEVYSSLVKSVVIVFSMIDPPCKVYKPQSDFGMGLSADSIFGVEKSQGIEPSTRSNPETEMSSDTKLGDNTLCRTPDNSSVPQTRRSLGPARNPLVCSYKERPKALQLGTKILHEMKVIGRHIVGLVQIAHNGATDGIELAALRPQGQPASAASVTTPSLS